MYFPDPQPGMVFQYSYLWVREHLEGQEERRLKFAVPTE